MRGVTARLSAGGGDSRISTHTPHARRDGDHERRTANPFSFLLTRLMRGVTQAGYTPCGTAQISTHTPHARRDGTAEKTGKPYKISTHTPHARRDFTQNTQ